MRLSYTLGAFLCALGIAMICAPNVLTPSNEGHTETPYIETAETAKPVRLVYIRFAGENSQMIQLQDVEGVLSQRLSEFSVE
jgi:hypothetical protein